MKIQIASDLHFEHGGSALRRRDIVGDVLVLAGDVAASPRHLVEKLRGIVPNDLPVVFVLGNHEFYDHDWTGSIAEYRNALNSSGLNVRLLENESKEIGGIRFLGCSLWTDYFGGKTAEFCEFNMADFYHIRATGKPLSWRDVAARYGKSLEWLSSALKTPFSGSTVVVTHHAPSALSQHPRWAGQGLGGAFYSNLDDLIEETAPVLWIHGHTHDPADYRIGETRVVCNPYGYQDTETNPIFKTDFVLEV